MFWRVELFLKSTTTINKYIKIKWNFNSIYANPSANPYQCTCPCLSWSLSFRQKEILKFMITTEVHRVLHLQNKRRILKAAKNQSEHTFEYYGFHYFQCCHSQTRYGTVRQWCTAWYELFCSIFSLFFFYNQFCKT